MPEASTPPTPAALPGNEHESAYEAYGVRIGINTNEEPLLERIRAFLPPEAQPCDPSTIQKRFELTAEDGSRFRLRFVGSGDESKTTYHDLELALGLLSMHMRGYIAVNAAERIFVHSGVVAHDGRMLLLPGESFSGKSSLVRALVDAGAIYYSDEYAVLDEEGRVYPYARPLALRRLNDAESGFEHTTHTIESLGGTAGVDPLRPSLIAITRYQPGAAWNPQRLSPGEAVLAMLGHTLPARERPEESLRAITRAVNNAVVIEGERGDASEVVPLLLAEVESAAGPHE